MGDGGWWLRRRWIVVIELLAAVRVVEGSEDCGCGCKEDHCGEYEVRWLDRGEVERGWTG